MTFVAVALVVALVVQQALHARERNVLLQRVQAPERAVLDHAASTREKPRRTPRVRLSDDAAIIAAQDRAKDGVE